MGVAGLGVDHRLMQLLSRLMEVCSYGYARFYDLITGGIGGRDDLLEVSKMAHTDTTTDIATYRLQCTLVILDSQNF